ncbi:MAG TPA: rubredoxin [Burkholderiales bacterium]|nr:rubredoxin [Burkholderiales bacterium]
MPKEKSGMRRWICLSCGLVYDEALGLPEEGIAPGTPWDQVPADWECPDCFKAKSDFIMVELKEDSVA